MKTGVTILALMFVAACGRGGVDLPADFAGPGGVAGLVRLCGNPNLLGKTIDPVDGAGACGISDAVSVHFISGVRLSQPATLNCQTANALASWVIRDAQPAVSRLRTSITEMWVLASYACRSRNNQSGARLSEHALGNAIDIGAFSLANGDVLNVENDWGIGKKGAALKRLHQSACGPFGTVLGPLSDRFHYNHFHFDTASYRSGAYCR